MCMSVVMCTLVGIGVEEDPKIPWMELDCKASSCEPIGAESLTLIP